MALATVRPAYVTSYRPPHHLWVKVVAAYWQGKGSAHYRSNGMAAWSETARLCSRAARWVRRTRRRCRQSFNRHVRHTSTGKWFVITLCLVVRCYASCIMLSACRWIIWNRVTGQYSVAEVFLGCYILPDKWLSVLAVVSRLRVAWPGVSFPAATKRFFSSSERRDRLGGPSSLLFNGYLVSFPGIKRPEHKVNHLHLVPRLSMTGAIRLLPERCCSAN